MNRTRTIALFAGIFAIAMTTYGLTGVSASPMIMSSIIPQTQENMGILGHVEFTVFDSDNNIKSYTQVDNVVVFNGKDCAGELLFGAVDGVVTNTCTASPGTFQFIAIGNGTAAADEANIQLASAGTSGCAETGAGQEGELARKQVTPTTEVLAAAGIGTDIVLETAVPFKFTLQNTTTGQTITQSGIFNAQGAAPVGGECDSLNAANWDMFSIRDITVAVTEGDSLSVKWTITLN